MPDAGWYRDPQDASAEEYWDGQDWSGQRRPSSESQPAYAQPTQQVWGARPDHGSQQAYGAPGYRGAPARRRRRMPFVVAGVVVVALVAAAVVTFLLRSGGSAPKITYGGRQIASPGAVLSSAAKPVDALVARRHGAKSSDTRCYFAQPTKPASGSKASDVIDSLRCGPVLFLDGHPAEEYLTVPLDADTSGTRVKLTPETSGLGSTSLTAVPRSLRLVRPDDRSAPTGDGGLTVPQPPPAKKDSIIAADLSAGDTPATVPDTRMISKNQDVMLLGAGFVSRYGTGPGVRSAPDGQRLLAFQISTGEGAIGSDGPAPTLLVDGDSRTIPTALGDQWDVAAVPTGSKPVIQLVADGFTQSLSLPGGKPGSRNISVLTRTNTIGIVSKNFTMHSTFSKNGGSRHDTLSVTASSADLYFWSPAHPESHPASPRFAYLSIDVTYTDPIAASKVFGFDPTLLHLRLPDGGTLTPRNLAGKNHIYNVFTVPANFTTGTLMIGGSGTIGHGLHESIAKAKNLAISIPAN